MVDPETIARDPSPEEVASLLGELEAVLAGFQQSEAEIVGLRLQGHSSSEIAGQVGCSRQTVRRVLNRVGHRLQTRLASGEE
jgi:DNA-binding CsgD family transcriptional regulator